MKGSGLIVLLALMLCCLGKDDSIDAEDFTGTLTVKADSSQSQEGTSIQVTAPIYSSKLKNINHQTIRVVVADPIGGCSPLNEFSFTDNYPIYYLVQGGQGPCTYARKCQMAKKALARGIIIVDSSSGINNLNFRNTDNDKFITLLISQDDAKKITGKKLIAELTMASTDKKKSALEIWVSSLNKDSYDTLDWWGDIVNEISSLSTAVIWKPRFAYYPCNTENICGGEYVTSCACGGEFCSPEAHGKSSNVLIREDIRQHKIFQKHPDKFLTYVKSFKKKCLETYLSSKYAEDCSSSILEELSLPNIEINNFIDSFLSSCDASDGQDIFRLYQDMTLDRNKYRQIGHYPTVILNHQQLQFKNKDDFKSLICRKLSLEQQSGCVSEKTTVMEGVITWLFYFITISLLLGIGAFVVIFFRNRLRREMNKQLKMQVSTAVEHYFSLSESNR